MSDAGRRAGTAYDTVAGEYDRHMASPANAAIRETLHACYSRYIPSGATVLDVGCGSGIDAIALAQRGCSVLAIDASADMVDLTRRRAKVNGVSDRVLGEIRSIESLVGDAAPFDAVVSAYAGLNTQASLLPFAEYCARVVRPNGVVILHVLNRWWWMDLPRAVRHGQVPFQRALSAKVGQVRLSHRRFSAAEVREPFRADFSFIEQRAAPLLGSQGFIRRVDGLPRLFVERFDRRFGATAPLCAFGEFHLTVFRRRA